MSQVAYDQLSSVERWRASQLERAPVYGEVQLSEICIDRYQRNADNSRVMRIVTHFDPNKMEPIQVSFRDGKYYCYDGQHRILAYRLMGKEAIPAVIHFGLSFQNEAELFYKQDDNVAKVTAAAKFSAQKESGDPALLEACRRIHIHGFVVRSGSTKDGRTINSHDLISKLASEMNVFDFERVFSTLEQGLQHRPYSGRKELIEGLALFIRTYSPFNNVDWRRLVSVLQDKDPKRILSDATAYHCQNMSTRVARILVKYYNTNLRTVGKVQKLPQKFFEQ